MSSGIVCKVWNIKGSLNASVDYVINEEKTTMELKDHTFQNNMDQLERECKYVINDIKTVGGAYVGTRNLVLDDTKSVVAQMMDIKKFYGKTGGRTALHGVISLDESESGVENAGNLMKLCNDVLKELFPNYQAIFAIHTNTENLHVHFIINSVGINGKKIHQPEGFVKNVIQPCVNKYAEKYGFTPNEKWKKYHTNGMTEFAKIKMDLRKMIDRAIENANSFDDFLTDMRLAGATINVGKHISVQIEGMDKAIRTHRLGSNYTKNSIVSRIQSRNLAFDKLDISNHILTEKENDIIQLKLSVLKKYKDMTAEEKKEAIHMLRLGKNPWKIHAQNNWQLQSIVDEINLSARVERYISFYSSDKTIQGALDGIVNAKKQISEEKKLLREKYKKYKPILDIYKEMKEIEKYAYLYEYGGDREYRKEYEKYRELTRRLQNGYAKDILEVSKFVQEYKDQTLYANAQLKELSKQYREIKKYCFEKGIEDTEAESLYDQIIDRKVEKMAKQNIFSLDVKYFVSSVSPDFLIRVVQQPAINHKGETVENTVVTILDGKGEVLFSIESKYDKKQFADYIYKLEQECQIKDCEQFRDVVKAKEYMKNLQRVNENMEEKTDNLVPLWHEVQAESDSMVPFKSIEEAKLHIEKSGQKLYRK